ncbi:4,5-dihydroxyphthalate decarboxylase [Planctomycetes bacterium CA13]|uniref:4,5-dihydroxyphthalate decarboxylase n=1 Tax=Novipirellula herctigrandis TaxID=2527986 RepID=A0A5C5ZCJ0_9BACT|nr:4,5-dihydroxyphthalate decarboxylase [Planctomycetes bacterium CA13]
MATFNRRDFCKAASIGAVAASGTVAGAEDGKPSANTADDPGVKKRTGPFGEGLPITMAGYAYNRVRAIIEGSVKIKGCAHQFEVSGIGPMNTHAFFGPQTRAVTELGLIPYILAYANDNFRDYLLLPIPALRLFRHQSIFVRTDRGIKTPADLRGKTVATVGYSSSGLTHVRGILQEEYGVSPKDIHWVSTQKDSAKNLSGGVSKYEKIRPDGLPIVDADPEEDESTLLIKGKVDAILHPAEPKVFQDRNPIVARLFTDHRSVEKAFYKRTGMFPIMHSVAIKREVAEQNPWLAKAVFEAYSKAKQLDYEYSQSLGWVMDSLPWYGQEFEETRELMGENFYPYGLQASASSYETAIRYVYDQGLSKRKASLEEMFEQSTIDLEETIG